MIWIFIPDLEMELPMIIHSLKIKPVSEIKGSFSLMHNGVFWIQIQWFSHWTEWFCSMYPYFLVIIFELPLPKIQVVKYSFSKQKLY